MTGVTFISPSCSTREIEAWTLEMAPIAGQSRGVSCAWILVDKLPVCHSLPSGEMFSYFNHLCLPFHWLFWWAATWSITKCLKNLAYYGNCSQGFLYVYSIFASVLLLFLMAKFLPALGLVQYTLLNVHCICHRLLLFRRRKSIEMDSKKCPALSSIDWEDGAAYGF